MNRRSLPWDQEYKITGIPKSLKPYPDKPVYDILYQAVEQYKKNGLIQFDTLMTFPEVKNKVDRLATALRNQGLKKGDRVATILPTSIQFIISDYAISRAGLVHIPSSSLEPLSTLEHKFLEGAPRALITLEEHVNLAVQIVGKCKVEHLILCRLDDYSNPTGKTTNASIPKNVLWMNELIERNPPSPPDITFDVENDIETLMFTGGTTGVAKGCMLTHRNIYSNALQNLFGFGITHKLLMGAGTVLLGLPFFHTYGHSLLHCMTLFGCNMLLVPDPRDTQGMIRSIRKYCPFMQIGVPTQFMKLSEELEGYAMLGISGSAPLPVSTQEKFEKKSGGGVMEGYGLSEMSPVTHLNTSYMIRIFGGRTAVRMTTILLNIPGTTWLVNAFLRLIGTRNVGVLLSKIFYLLAKSTRKKAPSTQEGAAKRVEKRGTIGVPFPDVEVKFLSVDTGKEISLEDIVKGERGEMCLRGPNRMLGYWPNPGSGIDKDGYVNTSDVVKIDDKGYFYIVDRTKDMVNVSGYKVYSREIDDILYLHPKVEMAATIGIPDLKREGSERIAVYIQPKEEYKNKISEDEIISYMSERVAKYAVPNLVKIIDTMPLTEIQKVDKKLLREMAKKELSA